jgi:hypothetical protein
MRIVITGYSSFHVTMKHGHLHILRLLPVLFLSGIIFSSCKETVTTPGGGTPGNIVGFVQLYDTLSQAISDNSGVVVSLPGSTISAVSDATGRWQLTNVPPGTYKIFFSKPGFSIIEDFNVVFQGNGTFYYNYGVGKSYTSIYQLQNLYPDIVLRPFEDYLSIVDTSYYDTAGYHYVYDTTIVKYYSAVFSSRSEDVTNTTATAIYFGKTKILDPINPKTFLYATDIHYNSDRVDSTGVADITILRSDLLKAGFLPGDSIYCSAFAGISNILNSTTWIDPETNKTVYSGFSPFHSQVRSFVLP